MAERCDVVIIGGGAAGLMCARVAGRRGRSVLILDHAKRPAEKIRISGGGRCNFTNMHSSPAAFLSNNRHFCKSAFTRYTQDDFVQLVYLQELFSLVLQKYLVAYHQPPILFVYLQLINCLRMPPVPVTRSSGHYRFIPNIKLQSTGNNETSRQNQFLFNTKRLLHSAFRLAPGDLLSAFSPYIKLGLQKILIINIISINRQMFN